MTIDEAIKILDQWYSLDALLPLDKAQDAIKLGISALIREKNNRINPSTYVGCLLLGETET